jgi:hypothetical protein
MTLIVLRHLPAVAAVEEQLRLQSLGLLPEEEAEELPHLIDDSSRALFGITANDTVYAALPEAVRARYGRAEWEGNFDLLGQFARDANAHWRDFGLDCCCEQGHTLHCLELFGRQLLCVVNGLHPLAVLAFVDREVARAA